jgi:hypothetical protein
LNQYFFLLTCFHSISEARENFRRDDDRAHGEHRGERDRDGGEAGGGEDGRGSAAGRRGDGATAGTRQGGGGREEARGRRGQDRAGEAGAESPASAALPETRGPEPDGGAGVGPPGRGETARQQHQGERLTDWTQCGQSGISSYPELSGVMTDYPV